MHVRYEVNASVVMKEEGKDPAQAEKRSGQGRRPKLEKVRWFNEDRSRQRRNADRGRDHTQALQRNRGKLGGARQREITDFAVMFLLV